MPFLTTELVEHIPNITPRILQNWDEKGYIKPEEKKKGYRRHYRRHYNEQSVFDILLLEECKFAGAGTVSLHRLFPGVARKIKPEHEYLLLARDEYLLLRSGQGMEQLCLFCKRTGKPFHIISLGTVRAALKHTLAKLSR